MGLHLSAALKAQLKNVLDEHPGDQSLRLVREIQALLENDPVWEEPSGILPVDELSIRLDHIKVIEQFYEEQFEAVTGKRQSKFQPFTESMVAAFLVMNRKTLEHTAKAVKVLQEDKPEDLVFANPVLLIIKRTLNVTTVLMKMFLTKKLTDQNIERGRGEMGNRTCIINGTRVPHFLPDFDLLLMGQKRKQTLQLESRFSDVSEKRWNEICLNQQLREWWGRAYFGFTCLGLDTPTCQGDETDQETAGQEGDTMVTLKLQFHWMPKRLAIRARRLTPEERKMDAYLAQFNGTWGNPNDPLPRVAFYRSTGRMLMAGDIFHAKVRYRDWEKMKQAFDIQWALTKIAAMAGGAEALEDEWNNYDKDGGIYDFVAEAREIKIWHFDLSGEAEDSDRE